MTDNYVVKDGTGTSVTFKSKDTGSGIQSPQNVPSDASGNPYTPSSPFPVSTGTVASASAFFNRPADTTAYASGDLVANSTTAGSVAPMAITAARTSGGGGIVTRARLSKSNASLTNAQFRVHLYRASPTPANGDNGSWSTDQALQYLGSIDVTLDKAFTDGAKGFGSPTAPGIVFQATAQTLYALIEARAAYTPASGETFTLALEIQQN